MSRALDRRSLRTWIDLDRTALAHNVLTFRCLLPPDCRLMAVCKSNASGHGISLTVSNLENLRALAAGRSTGRLRVHLKFDTGMHRQGFLPSEWEAALGLLRKCGRRIEVEGIYTPFASAKDPVQREYTEQQIGEFERAAARFREAGYSPIRHANAAAGGRNYPTAAD